MLNARLDTLSGSIPGLKKKVSIGSEEMGIADFISMIASSRRINISYDEVDQSTSIVQNLPKVSVKDALVFLCRKYDLDVSFMGSIMVVKKHLTIDTTFAPVHLPNISYIKGRDVLSINIKSDSLHKVVREIGMLSGKNIVYKNELDNMLVSATIDKELFSDAMIKFAITNGLECKIVNGDVYRLERRK